MPRTTIPATLGNAMEIAKPEHPFHPRQEGNQLTRLGSRDRFKHMDPFRLCIALLPLALYCLLLGSINLRRRPTLTTGPRDLAILAAALTGLVVVGPMELFLPEAAASRFGSYVWLLMLTFYGLAVSFAVLLSRPKLVIYNITVDELRPILAELVPTLDSEARWAGDSLALPQLGVQLHLDSFTGMRNVSLVATSQRQDFDGWRRLEKALADRLREARVQFNPRGASLVTCGVLLIVTCLVQTLSDPQALAQGMHNMLRW